jgi:hypothetical protein
MSPLTHNSSDRRLSRRYSLWALLVFFAVVSLLLVALRYWITMPPFFNLPLAGAFAAPADADNQNHVLGVRIDGIPGGRPWQAQLRYRVATGPEFDDLSLANWLTMPAAATYQRGETIVYLYFEDKMFGPFVLSADDPNNLFSVAHAQGNLGSFDDWAGFWNDVLCDQLGSTAPRIPVGGAE